MRRARKNSTRAFEGARATIGGEARARTDGAPLGTREASGDGGGDGGNQAQADGDGYD